MAHAALDSVSCILAWCLQRAGVAFGNSIAALLLIRQLSRFLEGRLTITGGNTFVSVPFFLCLSDRTVAFILGERPKVYQEEW